jgi:hypothetical protein
MNLDSQKRQELNQLFTLNRRVMKDYLPKESLERLRIYHYEGAMLRYFQNWINQLWWQRLVPFQNLAFMLLDHSDGILNYCRTKVRFGVVEASNGNIKTLFRRGRGCKNPAYLLLKAQRMAVTKTNSSFFGKQPKMRVSSNSRAEHVFLSFITFFAFGELGRVMGPDKLRDVFFRTGAPSKF